MPNDIDPTLPQWSRGLIAVLTQTRLAELIGVAVMIATLWAQSHWQHEERIAVEREKVAATREQTKAIQAAPPLVYGK